MPTRKSLPRYLPPVLASLLCVGCGAFGSKPEGERLKRLKASPHYRDGSFHNELETPVMSGSMWKLLKGSMLGKEERVPPAAFPFVNPAAAWSAQQAASDSLKVTWLGHSTLLVELAGRRVLIDPVFESHASPVPLFVKRFQAPPIARDSLPRIDAVIISHDHYDHLEMESIRAFRDHETVFVVPLGVGAHLEGWGIPPARIVELDWWQEHQLGGVKLVCTPARHFSGRGVLDRGKTLWAGWSLIGETGRLHYSGDGGYGPHFKEIGERLGPFDLTLIENGAYNDLWAAVHMFPEQGVQAHEDLRGRVMLPVHWGMFNLGFHDWFEPVTRVQAAAKARGVRLVIPRLGETISPHDSLPVAPWWNATAREVADNR